MAKKKPLKYPEQMNFLDVAGRHDTLVALAFYRGDRGAIGTAARAMMSIGIETYLNGLSPDERKRFNEILGSVKKSSAMKNSLSG